MFGTISRLAGLFVFAGVVSLASTPVLAVPVAFEFTGTWWMNNPPGDPFSSFDNGSLEGTGFSGTFVIDDGLPDDAPGGTTGLYNLAGAPYGMTLSTTGLDVSISAPMQNKLTDTASFDFYQVYTEAGNAASVAGAGAWGIGPFVGQLLLTLTDIPGDALNSDAWTLPDLAAYFLSELRLTLTDSTGFTSNLAGSLNTLTVAAVPLPAGAVLLGSGLAALGFLGWRRKRAPIAA